MFNSAAFDRLKDLEALNIFPGHLKKAEVPFTIKSSLIFFTIQL